MGEHNLPPFEELADRFYFVPKDSTSLTNSSRSYFQGDLLLYKLISVYLIGSLFQGGLCFLHISIGSGVAQFSRVQSQYRLSVLFGFVWESSLTGYGMIFYM